MRKKRKPNAVYFTRRWYTRLLVASPPYGTQTRLKLPIPLVRLFRAARVSKRYAEDNESGRRLFQATPETPVV